MSYFSAYRWFYVIKGKIPQFQYNYRENDQRNKPGKKVDHPGIDISMMGGPPGALGALARQHGMNVMAANNNGNNNGNPTDKILQNTVWLLKCQI